MTDLAVYQKARDRGLQRDFLYFLRLADASPDSLKTVYAWFNQTSALDLILSAIADHGPDFAQACQTICEVAKFIDTDPTRLQHIPTLAPRLPDIIYRCFYTGARQSHMGWFLLHAASIFTTHLPVCDCDLLDKVAHALDGIEISDDRMENGGIFFTVFKIIFRGPTGHFIRNGGLAKVLLQIPRVLTRRTWYRISYCYLKDAPACSLAQFDGGCVAEWRTVPQPFIKETTDMIDQLVRLIFQRRVTEIAIALQGLRLPVLMTLEIVDMLLANDYTMHFKWRVLQTIKHFR